MESLERVSPGFTKQRLSGSVSWDWRSSERRKRLLQAQLRIPLMSSRKAVWPAQLCHPKITVSLFPLWCHATDFFGSWFSVLFQVAIKKISLLRESSNELCVNEIQVMRDNKNANLVNYVDR